MPLLELADTEIYFEEAGSAEGPVVIALHGGLGLDHAYLRPHWDKLGERNRLVYMDARGNGRSGRPPLPTITMPQLADDVEALRRHLGVETVGLVGHSYGGFIALETALRWPDSVEFLVLVDTSPGQSPDEVAPLDLTEPQMTNEEFIAEITPILPLYFHAFDPALAEGLMSDTIISGQVGAWSMQALRSWSAVNALPSISAPTLVVVGASDRICPPAASEVIASRIPGARLEVIEEAGHFPWLEQAARYDEVIDGFLRGFAP